MDSFCPLINTNLTLKFVDKKETQNFASLLVVLWSYRLRDFGRIDKNSW